MKHFSSNKAQVHILEVIIVAGILLVSLYFIRGFDFTPSSIVTGSNSLQQKGLNIISRLESIPDPDGELSSILSRYMFRALKGDNSSLNNYISNSLPQDVIYEIFIVNVSKMSKYAGSVDDCRTVVYEPIIKIGEKTSISRVVVIDGYIYKIDLGLWFN